MSGYLTSGAMSGVAGEWLKQGDEKRAANYQMIRDKRIAGMRKDATTYESELKTTENMRQEDVAAGVTEQEQGYLSTEATARDEARQTLQDTELHTLGRGQESYDSDGNLIASGPAYTHAPSAGSSTMNKFMLESVDIRGSGGKGVGRRTRQELKDEWYEKAYEELDNPEFPGLGLKIKRRSPEYMGWVEYHNSMVTDQWKMAPDDPQYMQGDPEALWDYAQRTFPGKLNTPEGRSAAIERIKQANPQWGGPSGSGSLDDPSVPSPNPNDPNPGAGVGDPGRIQQTAATAADATQAVVTQPQNAGVTSGGMLPEVGAAPGEISVQPGTTFAINETQIKKIEDMLKNPNWNTLDRQRLEKKLAELKAAAGQ